MGYKKMSAIKCTFDIYIVLTAFVVEAKETRLDVALEHGKYLFVNMFNPREHLLVFPYIGIVISKLWREVTECLTGRTLSAYIRRVTSCF